MKIDLLATSFLLSFAMCSLCSKELGKSLRLFLDVLNRPVMVTAVVCWKTELSIKFLETFNSLTYDSKQYAISIRNIEMGEFELPTLVDEHQEFVLLDLNCESAGQFLEKNQNKLSLHFTWLIINSHPKKAAATEANVLKLFEQMPILPRSEIFFMASEESTGGNVIKQVYRTAMEQPLIIEAFGSFINDTFNDRRSSPITSRRRQNLQGVNLKASMVVTNNDTLNHLSDYIDPHIDPISKVNYKLTNYLMNYLNATVQYSVVNSWGYKNDETSEWSGMVGQLIRKETELGASPLFMTIDRVPLIQYIAMPSPTGSRFVFRSPKLSYTDNVFLLPFNSLVWYCLIGLVVVTAICFLIAVSTEWKFYSQNYDTDSSLLRPSIGDVSLLVFGATCQQGSAVAPRSMTSRIIMVVAYTILMFLYTSYSANIVAMLQSPSTKIRTLADLYNSRLQMGVDDTVFNHYYFSHATDPLRKSIYENKVLLKGGRSNFMPLEQGVAKIREGLFAFHMEMGIGYKIMSETFFEHEKCGLKEIAFLQVTEPWYAIRKHSSYKELFKIGMMRMREHGLQERENARLYTPKPKCSGSGGNFITASLVDTKPAMLVLLWGMLLAFLFLIFEFLLKRFEMIKKKREEEGEARRTQTRIVQRK